MFGLVGAVRRFKTKKKQKVALDIYDACNEIYFNGTHTADYKSLSIYDRPRDRNNQNLEGAHDGAINLGKADFASSARRSYYRWINTAQKEEVGFTNREYLYQINLLNSALKVKDKKLQQKYDTIASLVDKHKRNEITFNQLFQKYIVLISEKNSSS